MSSGFSLQDFLDSNLIQPKIFKGYAEEYVRIEGKEDGRDVSFMSDDPEEEARAKFFSFYPEAIITKITELKRLNKTDYGIGDGYKWEFTTKE